MFNPDLTLSTLSKAELRQKLLKSRQEMDSQVWQTKSLQLCHHLYVAEWFTHSQTVLAYFSTRQEPDLSLLFDYPKIWGFPRCVDRQLVWHQWSPQNSLPRQKGAFGILEPHPDAAVLDVSHVDLILVPAVACDRQGYRLGYGGGFYDRLLSSPGWATKPTIGIVFDCAVFPQLPHDPWDCPLHAICTESGLWQPMKSC